MGVIERTTEEKPPFTGIIRIPVVHSSDTGIDLEVEEIVEQLGGRPFIQRLAREMQGGVKRLTLALSTMLHLH